ncbi:uncharacterized protein [Diabrotica undecimpunctata]|uniref:uncharacterized protein n=1 Tax=Diabrotica undecimpunctata TaxID=50387 RepID=UPI003B632460
MMSWIYNCVGVKAVIIKFTMSGIHTGVQARIKENKIMFVPCANHSPNLCGFYAFAINPSCVTFLATLESVYNFFSSSLHRLGILMEDIGVSVKQLSDTRWSANHESVKLILKHFDKLVQVREKLCEAKENITRGSAEIFLWNICDFTFLGFLYLWGYFLQEINSPERYLQEECLTLLEKVVIKLRSLKVFFEDSRYELSTKALPFASEKCDEMGISLEKNSRRYLKR